MILENTKFVQKCVVYDKFTNKILILKRSDYKPSSVGKWDFLGGGYDNGENSKDALKREGVEETNIKLNDIYVIENFVKLAKKDDCAVIFALNYCDDYNFINGEVKLSNEHVEFKWIDLNELDKYEFMFSIEKLKILIKPFILRFNK